MAEASAEPCTASKPSQHCSTSKVEKRNLRATVAFWVETLELWAAAAVESRLRAARRAHETLAVGFARFSCECTESKHHRREVRRLIKVEKDYHYREGRKALKESFAEWVEWRKAWLALQLTKQYELLRVAAKDGALGVIEGLLQAKTPINTHDASDHATALMR